MDAAVGQADMRAADVHVASPLLVALARMTTHVQIDQAGAIWRSASESREQTFA